MAGSIMATTTNYSWSTPDNTAYVKDGASAIRTLGSSVDTTLYTALGGAYPGLRLVKKQTIGSAVSSVTVTDAFSTTYDNYKIIVSGGTGSVDADISVKLGSTTTGYYYGLLYTNYNTTTPLALSGSNAAAWLYAGTTNPNNTLLNMELNDPFNAARTGITGMRANLKAALSYGPYGGFLDNTTSYTAFTLTPSAGTLTGGTIYVYGYGKS